MFCQKCGTEIVDDKCPKCNKDVLSKHDIKGAKAFGIICLATGAASILYGFFFAIISFVTGALYVNRAGKASDMVKIGRVLAIIGIVRDALAIIIAVLGAIIYFVCVIAIAILPFILGY
jgi:uncharacterized membrane protein